MKNKEKYAKEMCQFLIGKVQREKGGYLNEQQSIVSIPHR